MTDLMGRITVDPDICHGQPVIRGLRYPVEVIVDLLRSGMTIDDVLADFPDLEHADILAVMAYVQQPLGLDASTSDTMLASEAVLARDWLTPEEDTAWAHL